MEFNFDRVRRAAAFAFMLHVFYSKREQEETALLFDRRFDFVPERYCIFLTGFPASQEIGSFCKDKHAVLLRGNGF